MAKRVLIIEDNQDVRLFEEKLLERFGYEVLKAAGAQEGTRLAKEEKPDIVIMDIRLPSKKRGIGAARILRGQEETKDTPIIFVTGCDMQAVAGEIKNIPNCGYVTKPFRAEDLLAEIERMQSG